MKTIRSGLRNVLVLVLLAGLSVLLIALLSNANSGFTTSRPPALAVGNGSPLTTPTIASARVSPLATPTFNSPLATPTPGGPMPKIYAISNDGEWLDFEAMAQSLLLLQGSHTGNRQTLPTPPAR